MIRGWKSGHTHHRNLKPKWAGHSVCQRTVLGRSKVCVVVGGPTINTFNTDDGNTGRERNEMQENFIPTQIQAGYFLRLKPTPVIEVCASGTVEQDMYNSRKETVRGGVMYSHTPGTRT